MIPAPARYLLRLDDLCPTMHRERWQQFRSLIAEFALKPILAVVPDNRDAALDVSPPDPDFWNQLRALESAGAIIGLHGLHHLCVSQGRSLLGVTQESEFAGVTLETQRTWLAEGLRLLRSHGLNPRIFVAPRHGFDAITLRALSAENLPLLKPRGLWTICMHPNTARDRELEQLRAFLRVHADQFISVDHVLADFPPSPLPVSERIYASVALGRVKASRWRARAPGLGRISSNSR